MIQHSTDPVKDVLYRIKRGLPGYVSYLAACEMNSAFSEYVLYEPILRILTARRYEVSSEVECPGYPLRRGDKKRLDFVAKCTNAHLAIEVKWLRQQKPKLDADIEKLRKYQTAHPDSLAVICLFGKKSHITKIACPNGFRERGQPVVADFGVTRYGCRIFQLT